MQRILTLLIVQIRIRHHLKVDKEGDRRRAAMINESLKNSPFCKIVIICYIVDSLCIFTDVLYDFFALNNIL